MAPAVSGDTLVLYHHITGLWPEVVEENIVQHALWGGVWCCVTPWWWGCVVGWCRSSTGAVLMKGAMTA